MAWPAGNRPATAADRSALNIHQIRTLGSCTFQVSMMPRCSTLQSMRKVLIIVRGTVHVCAQGG